MYRHRWNWFRYYPARYLVSGDRWIWQRTVNFTAHNLRVLEVLSDKSIVFNIKSEESFYDTKGVRDSNNLRTYIRAVNIDDQPEEFTPRVRKSRVASLSQGGTRNEKGWSCPTKSFNHYGRWDRWLHCWCLRGSVLQWATLALPEWRRVAILRYIKFIQRIRGLRGNYRKGGGTARLQEIERRAETRERDAGCGCTINGRMVRHSRSGTFEGIELNTVLTLLNER